VTTNRTDFHVGFGGELITFPVWMRSESVRVGASAVDLEIAYLPETWPAMYPQCVLGMDIPVALECTRFVLDPVSRELRFYRRRSPFIPTP